LTPERPKPAPSAFSSAVERLRARYRDGSAVLVQEFRELADRLEADPASLEPLQTVKDRAHRIRGTAGSYGFARVSELAAAIEREAMRWISEAEAGRRDGSTSRAIRDFAAAVEVAFREG